MRGWNAVSLVAIVLCALGASIALLDGGGRASGGAVAMSAALAAAAASMLLLAARRQGARPPRALVLVALLTCAWGALGAVRLPGGVLEALSPKRAAIERALPRGEDGVSSWAAAMEGRSRGVSEILGEAALPAPDLSPALGPPVAAPASFAPWATRSASLVLAAFLLLLVALASLPSERPGLLLVAASSVLAVVTAVAGAWGSRAAPGLLFGRWEPHENVGTLPWGAFWSPNHAAALLALTCPILLGCALDSGRSRAWRALALLSLPVVALGLLDVGSRGGLLAGGVAALLLGAALARRPGTRAAGAGLIALALIGVALAFTVLSERVLGESFRETMAMRGSNLERSTLYELQGRMVRSSPVVGSGLGAFRTAQAVFRDEADSMVPLHGESDWLETAVEGGVPLLLGWIALVVLLLGPALRLALRGQAPPLLAGLVAGACACLAHAAVDFHLREPVVAFAAIGAAGAAAAWASRLRREDGADAGGSAAAGTLALAAGALVTIASVMVLNDSVAHARAHRSAERLAAQAAEEAPPERRSELLRQAAQQADAAVLLRPGNGDSWALLGWIEESRAALAKPGVERRERRAAAMAASVRALESSAAAFGAARRCASLLVQAGAHAEAVDAVRLALLVAPGHGATHRVAGQLLLRSGPSPEALDHLAQAFRALPLARIHGESRALASWILEAAGGDAVAGMEAIGDPQRIAWYVSELHRLGREQEARDCLRALAAEPPRSGADALAGLIVLVGGPEATDLARSIESGATTPLSRQRVGMALVRGGRADEAERGLRLIREGIEAGLRPPEAFLILAEGEAARGDMAASEAALRQGIAVHPDSEALRARLPSVTSP